MTAHKHAALIKAKADNMDLVIFVKYDDGWALSGYEELIYLPDREFFLCLPQHKKECLHWLRGGLVSCSTSAVVEYLLPHPEYKWSTAHHFMCEGEILELIKA